MADLKRSLTLIRDAEALDQVIRILWHIRANLLTENLVDVCSGFIVLDFEVTVA